MKTLRTVPFSALHGVKVLSTRCGSQGLMPRLGSYGAETIITDGGTFIFWHAYGEVNLSQVEEVS